MEASALHARAPSGLSRSSGRGLLLRVRSDDQLVALFRLGNDDAFRVIHDRYRQRLLAYTRQMLGGSRSDAEDALQDVLLRAYGALRQDDRPVSLRAWLYRVAHNRCIDQLRRPAPPVAELFEASRPPVLDPTAETERREELRRLVADVRRLPEQQRSALLMRELEGLSYRELADALGVTVPAIKSLLVRARIGLVAENEARDTACADIRSDLVVAGDKGVRASGRARRHLRECRGCREYRTSLRAMRSGLSALSPAGPGLLGTLAKLLGIGGASSGAAAGGSAAVGGAAVGGGVATVTATKVAALVCCAALTGGTAVEVSHEMARPARHGSGHMHPTPVARPAGAALTTASQATAAVPAGAAQAPVSRGRSRAVRDRHLAGRRGAEQRATRGALVLPGAQGVPATPTTPAAPVVTGGVQAPSEQELPSTPTTPTDTAPHDVTATVPAQPGQSTGDSSTTEGPQATESTPTTDHEPGATISGASPPPGSDGGATTGSSTSTPGGSAVDPGSSSDARPDSGSDDHSKTRSDDHPKSGSGAQPKTRKGLRQKRRSDARPKHGASIRSAPPSDSAPASGSGGDDSVQTHTTPAGDGDD